MTMMTRSDFINLAVQQFRLWPQSDWADVVRPGLRAAGEDANVGTATVDVVIDLAELEIAETLSPAQHEAQRQLFWFDYFRDATSD